MVEGTNNSSLSSIPVNNQTVSIPPGSPESSTAASEMAFDPNNPWFVAGMSLLAVAVVISLITLGFCLGRRYCCKAPSVVLNAGSPLPFWHRAWNTMGVYRPCGGHRCASSHHYCSRTTHHC